MPTDLIMLRVACRVVEGDRRDGDATTTVSTTSTALNANTTNIMLPRLVLPTISTSTATSTAAPWAARRIPMPALHRPQPPAADAADLVLGLKRDKRPLQEEVEGDDEDADTPRPSKRARLPPPPGVFMDSPLAKLVHARRPPPPLPPGLSMISPLGVEGMVAAQTPSPLDSKSQTRVPPQTFISSMGHASTHTRLQVTTTDVDDAPLEKLSPLESPRLLDPVSITALRIPTLPQWRSPSPHASPLPPLSSATNAPWSTSSMPPLSLPAKASTKPTLVRTSSSAAWRQNMPPQDRARTRERLLRGLDRQSRGDYDALVQIVAALEEELLHAHTTARDHYFMQAVALTDRILTVAPARTATSPL